MDAEDPQHKRLMPPRSEPRSVKEPSRTGHAEAHARVLLVTPQPGVKDAAYGGGMGGYVRMAGVLLKTFAEYASGRIELVPCYHSVRRKGRFHVLRFPARIASDVRALARMAPGADAVHITLAYRRTIYREFAQVALARRLGLPVLVDIRAGEFQRWYERAPRWERWLTRRTLAWADLISVEGVPYLDFVREEFGRESVYFPNFVPAWEIPEEAPPKCQGGPLRLLYAGYCYDGKGVYELVEGCAAAARRGVEVELTLAGAEAPGFKAWLDAQEASGLPMPVRRLGLQPHDRVLELFREHDVFCLPSRHPGEGHSNVTNEAMMTGMVIVCTRHGFLGSILDEESAFFIEKGSAEAVADGLAAVAADPEAARAKARAARRRLVTQFSSASNVPLMERMYASMIEGSPAEGMPAEPPLQESL